MLTVDPNQRIGMSSLLSHPWCMTWVSPELRMTGPADPRSQSQLSREQIPEALTQGMRSNGMMAIADPTFNSPASQAYAIE